MKAAIYARYSSENQSEKSIDDQVRVCRKFIENNDMTVEDRHIFIYEAISGSIINRPGLQALENAAESGEFVAVAVDDLSRLSRSNHQMLTLVLRFNYYQVKIISVSDGIITDDDNSKLDIHVRGLINELYLDDLKKKTIRGYSAGENVYGYYTKPSGKLKVNKKGQHKYDGMVHVINPDEAEVVKKIFSKFINGKSISNIVKDLNKEKIPTKRGYAGGWNTSTVSRILKNEKYTGLWIWKKHKNVRDPMTGKRKKVKRPESEQLKIFKEELIIIDKETWENSQKRWREISHAFPVRKGSNSKKTKQKSYVHSNPPHLLSGLMKCSKCGGAIVLVSGKGSGYYGCFNAKRKTCNNTLIAPRKRIEEAIISDLKNKILTVENIQYVYKNVEKLISKGLNDIPEKIKKKKQQYDKILSEIQNYLNYIKIGNFSNAVSEALKDTEEKGETLKKEINLLSYQKQNKFISPPREWLKHRLDKLRDTLNKNTTTSSKALKELLGTISMEPVTDNRSDFFYIVSEGDIKFKPYYIAHTKIQTLALLDDKHKGSNWLHWRRGRDSNPRKENLQRFSRPSQSTRLCHLSADGKKRL